MAKGKYQYWLSEDGLLLLRAWARDGLTDDLIAQKMNISRETLYQYKKKYADIADSLKKGKELVDIEVENALYRKALDGDTTAMIFWLKNRKPKKWRDKQEVDQRTTHVVEENVLDAMIKAAGYEKK